MKTNRRGNKGTRGSNRIIENALRGDCTEDSKEAGLRIMVSTLKKLGHTPEQIAKAIKDFTDVA